MGKNKSNSLIVSLKRCALLVVAVLCSGPLAAQSGLYVPSAKPVRDMQKALTNPEAFYLLLSGPEGATAYSEDDLDLLDSAYGIAFSLDNPMLYTMTIEGYGGADENLTKQRVDAVYRYFAMRSHAQFPIRYARNPIHCSCQGDTTEVLRFEVPVSTAVYRYAELPETRRLLNKSVDLKGSVLITFRNNPDECVGSARGCYVPREDSTVYGYYASLLLSKGSVYAVENTKDTCPGGLQIKIDDYLDYKYIMERYRLIPHRKQILVQAGFIVVHCQLPVALDSCSEVQKDSIFVRIPVTQEQLDAKLKFFAKVRTSRGMEYKQLPTRKVPGKGVLALQAPVNVTQLDTIYLGKRIQDKEVSKYFYEVSSPTEAASFAIGDRFYVASRPGKDGQPELKKPLKQLFRIIPDQEEDTTPVKTITPKGEEIIEE
ncbi:MAG: hypothetical protein IJ524_04715 [Bacteroidales bacterium]|nr:hypothetical protein [Bacteroidales bacterium]